VHELKLLSETPPKPDFWPSSAVHSLVTQEQEVRLILNRGQGWDLIASKFECGMEVPGTLEVMWK